MRLEISRSKKGKGESDLNLNASIDQIPNDMSFSSNFRWLTLMASIPWLLVLVPWSLMMMNGRPY
jgi:hypothetical protein